ncbi:MAG: Asp-tRNA(Asn)/Glu-tRNA(Gln) amidotransferase subunit GatC [Patescibacteria group bacterium]|nr:Asp-tRNA(Asn)/Glu-tRNA(Gln) amidotransferase subunit GatC [Patescibacteria group bacterium]
MPKLKKSEVQHLANLAKLELTEEETKKFQGQLSSILDYVKTLNEVDTAKVEPTAQVTGQVGISRRDEIQKDARQKDILDQAPRREGKNYRVKAVFGK